MRSRFSMAIRRLAAPALAIACAVALGVAWSSGNQAGGALISSILNATLFLMIGLIIRDASIYRSPLRAFWRMFRGIEQGRLQSGREAYQVILPHFEINPAVYEHLSTILDAQSADKAVFDLYKNPSVRAYMKDHKVTLDVAVAGNDSEAGGVIASCVGRLTQGVITPTFRTDEGNDLTRPAVLLGLYSNSWVWKYWQHTGWEDLPGASGVFLPMPHQVGFWVRCEKNRYIRFLPLHNGSGRNRELPDFWTQNSPEIHQDYAIVARVRGHDSPNAVWFVCAGIGKVGTIGAAEYLARDSNLEKILQAFSSDEEFGLVLQVSAANPAEVREVHCWPQERRRLTADGIDRDEATIDQIRIQHRQRKAAPKVQPIARTD